MSVEMSPSKTLLPDCTGRAGWRPAWLTLPEVCEWMIEWLNGWILLMDNAEARKFH
jgi:hypothetical protein